jgi:hypothetical protein
LSLTADAEATVTGGDRFVGAGGIESRATMTAGGPFLESAAARQRDDDFASSDTANALSRYYDTKHAAPDGLPAGEFRSVPCPLLRSYEHCADAENA